jgi:hypothetical protein
LYRVSTPAPSALQAGGRLDVTASGNLVNTGNLYGQAVSLGASNLTNGITDPSVPPIQSTVPNAVIALLGPDLGAGVTNAQNALNTATSNPVNGAQAGLVRFLNCTVSGHPERCGCRRLRPAGRVHLRRWEHQRGRSACAHPNARPRAKRYPFGHGRFCDWYPGKQSPVS